MGEAIMKPRYPLQEYAIGLRNTVRGGEANVQTRRGGFVTRPIDVGTQCAGLMPGRFDAGRFGTCPYGKQMRKCRIL